MSCKNIVLIAVCLSLSLFLIAPVQAYSADAVALYTSGSELTDSGNYSAALTAYSGAVSLEPAYFEAWNGIADVLNRNGQYGDALEASNRSLGINPDYVDGWINRGYILYNIGQYEDEHNDTAKASAYYAAQLDSFEQAIKIDPNNADAWFNEGYALAGLKRYDEAISAFDRVQAIDPSYRNLQKNREIAVQLRDASTPVYMKYALPLAVAGIAIVGAIVWFASRRKKED